jgi:hypothetical protein
MGAEERNVDVKQQCAFTRESSGHRVEGLYSLLCFVQLTHVNARSGLSGMYYSSKFKILPYYS